MLLRRTAHLLEKLGCCLLRIVLPCQLLQLVKQLAPCQVLHDQHHLVAVIHDVLTPHDVGMLQLLQEIGFPAWATPDLTRQSRRLVVGKRMDYSRGAATGDASSMLGWCW